MRSCEADWICGKLLALGPEKASPVENLGSSTLQFRTNKKPHIENRLFNPLRRAGFEIVHIDMRDDEGVDLVGDLTSSEFLEEIKSRQFRSVICSNLLEHLVDREACVQACADIVGEDGILVVTVPYSYPYHADPIDTLYRPSPKVLANDFTEMSMIESEVLVDGTLVAEEFSSGFKKSLLYVTKAMYRVLNILRPRIALSQLHRFAWFFLTYKVTCAVFSKSEKN